MKKANSYLLITLSLFLCTISLAQTEKVILPEDYKKHFDKYSVKGSFVAFDLKNNKTLIYDEERANTRFTPASTFKIFNSLVGLETGVIPDTSFIISWDGVKRGSYAPWHRANSLQSAFKYSVVWYYQELARRVGEEKMQELLSLNKYGNESIEENLDSFWLSDDGGKLRISQVEQIDFLKKLFHEKLNFSKRSQRLVKGIMLLEENDEYRLLGKTGMGSHDGVWYGWFVGWIEKGDDTYFFANNIESKDSRNLMNGGRKGITLAVLQDLGFIQKDR